MNKKTPPKTLQTTTALEQLAQIKGYLGVHNDQDILPAIQQLASAPLHMVIEARNGQAPTILWTSQPLDIMTAIEVLQATSMQLAARQKQANQKAQQDSQVAQQAQPPENQQLGLPLDMEKEPYNHEGE